MSSSTGLSQRWDRVSLITTFVYQGLVIIVFLIVPFLAYQYIQMPFIGAFIDNTMVVNNVHPEPVPANWDLILHWKNLNHQNLRVLESIKNMEERLGCNSSSFAYLLANVSQGILIRNTLGFSSIIRGQAATVFLNDVLRKSI